MSANALESREAAGAGLHALLQPQGGLFSSVARVRAQSAEPRLTTRIARLGDLSQVGVPVKTKADGRQAVARLAGAGTGLEDGDGLRPALAEGLERYSTAVFRKDQFLWATAEELGAEALDLDTIPRCSRSELSHPLCPLVAPDKRAPIRWVRGVSLLDGRLVYVPAVMVYLYVGVASPAERIWLTITTGCAAHVSYERALANAILEVVERDAISLVWLHQLRLPRIEIDQVPSLLAPYWERYQRSTRDLEYALFDATTDVGFPTVYGIQVARAHKRLTTLVSCSTEMTPVAAVAKALQDMTPGRISMRDQRSVPESLDEFDDVFHGAAYMARAERAEAFDFLLGSEARRRLSEMPGVDGAGAQPELGLALERLRRRGLEAYAVDLTTDEAVRCGVRVVRVVVPGLQPLSFHYRARYLGHPRLYEAPVRMGHPARTEQELNPLPQPFA